MDMGAVSSVSSKNRKDNFLRVFSLIIDLHFFDMLAQVVTHTDTYVKYFLSRFCLPSGLVCCLLL